MDAGGIRVALGENLTDEEENQLIESIKQVNEKYSEPDEDCLSFETFIMHMKERKNQPADDDLSKAFSKID